MSIKIKLNFYFLGVFIMVIIFLSPSLFQMNELKKEQAVARENAKWVIEILSLSAGNLLTSENTDAFSRKLSHVLSGQDFTYCFIHKKRQ